LKFVLLPHGRNIGQRCLSREIWKYLWGGGNR